MDVTGLGGVGRTNPAYTPRPTPETRPAAAHNTFAPQDEVEISSAGRALESLGKTSELRQQRISQIQQAIADGTYDTDEKFQAALDKLLGEYDLG